jgi:hypothetical protein
MPYTFQTYKAIIRGLSVKEETVYYIVTCQGFA